MTVTTVSSLDGLFKSVYGDELVNLIPSENIVQRNVPFKSGKKIGKSFEFPVELRREHGATYAAAGSGGFTLNSSQPMTLDNVLVDGYQLVLRGQLDYEAASKAVSGGPAAFASATSTQIKSLLESARNRIEVACLYGQSDRGIGVATGSTNASATSTVVNMRAADFAPGLWSAFEGANIEFRQLGALTNLVSSSTDAVFVVSAVDTSAKTITVTGTATGITALDAILSAGGSPLVGSPQTAFAIFFAGAYGNEQVGLDKIITNTGSLFGVNAATYSLWKGNTYSNAGAALTFEAVNEANSAAVSKGLDGDVTVLVSPSQWNNILNDQAALRRYQSAGGQWANGARGIKFESQNGTITFVAHKFVKDGDAYIAPMKELVRVGAQDISFTVPGSQGARIFRHLDDAAAYEFRLYSNQNLAPRRPAWMTKMTNFAL